MAEKRIEGRNGRIWQGFLSGKTQDALAEEFGLSQARVSQIISEVRAGIGETKKEELFQREMDFIDSLRTQAMELVTAPLPPAFSQKGYPLVDENGQVVRDASGRLNAMKMAVALHERVSKLTGLDAPVKADLTITEAAEEAARARAAEAMARINGLVSGE